MIVVDIDVESMGQTYDFKLDENTLIIKLIDEMCELISRKEKCAGVKNPGELILCKKRTGQIFPHNYTLSMCGIVSGDKLILV